MYRGIEVSYEAVHQWSLKFGTHFKNVIKKCESRLSNKWHMDEPPSEHIEGALELPGVNPQDVKKYLLYGI
ncbi:MAG: hypothetical protein LEGION0403_FIIPPAGN_01721 [Legionella sp.]|uniref:hypothetical protein n=1 Tax=Legionella sp. TaxID=459 RepID=UPI003D0ED892